jgi:glycosyltransferase involved in cell wall biosynthesis
MSYINNPLVTIAIPLYNADRFLKDAIQSVLNQTYKDFELLIIDDGSTDSSINIVKSFNDNRIKLVIDGKNKGLPVRLNQIAQLTNTKFLARMDADDIMHYDRIKIQVEYLLAHPSVQVVGSHAYCIDANNNIVGISKNKISTPCTIKDILSGSAFIHPTVMAYTSWFQKNPYDESCIRVEDLALWLRTVSNSNFYILPEKLLYYRTIEGLVLSKYLHTQRTFRRFVIHNNMIFKDKWLQSKLYFLSACKSIIYLFFHVINRSDFLIKKRYKTVSQKDTDNFKKELLLSIKEI